MHKETACQWYPQPDSKSDCFHFPTRFPVSGKQEATDQAKFLFLFSVFSFPCNKSRKTPGKEPNSTMQGQDWKTEFQT